MELSVQEESFVRQLLATRAIPSPKLLIQDHKKINEKGEFLTRLLIPATKFTAAFSLAAVGKTLLKEAFNCQRFEFSNRKTSEIYKVLQRLKKYGCVCVLTDKTNSTRVQKN